MKARNSAWTDSTVASDRLHPLTFGPPALAGSVSTVRGIMARSEPVPASGGLASQREMSSSEIIRTMTDPVPAQTPSPRASCAAAPRSAVSA